MGLTDNRLGLTGEQDGRSVAADTPKRRKRWRRRLALATATAAGAVVAIRWKHRRDDSEFTRIPIEGESASVDQ